MNKKLLFIQCFLLFAFCCILNMNAADKNIALNKAAYHSSAVNYDNTGHLVTDGDFVTYQTAIISCQYADSPSGEAKEMAFDGTVETKFLTFHQTCWIQYAFSQDKAYAIDKYTLASANDEASRDPKSWTLLASNDGENWVTLDTQSNITFSERKQTKTFPITNNVAYKIYRLNVTENGGDSRLQFSEFGLYEGDASRIEEIKFSSEWISKTAGNQWVYVDLGTICTINKVKLHWGEGYAKAYSIEISNDAKNWQSIHSVTSGDGGTDDITISTSARYVRMNATECGFGNNYSLKEFEIYGTGDKEIVPSPLPGILPDGTQFLSGGNWKLQRASYVTGSGEQISQAAFDDKQWIIATVPGTVLTSYLNNGAIPDPNFGDQQLQISDAFFTTDFWYRNSFVVPTTYTGKRVFLNFDGINWKADIYVNGQKIGRIDGAFIHGKFDVTSLVTPGETAYLAVFIHKNDTPGAVTLQSSADAGPNGGALGADNPTIHASVGWDWLPTIRGRNTGIHDEVFLSASGDVTIENPFVISKLPLPETTSADLSLVVDLKNHKNVAVNGVLKGTINPGNITFSQSVSLNASEAKTVTLDKNTLSQLMINNPQLWWPNGYGEQFMYDLSLSFEVDGVVSETKEIPFGIREVTTSTAGNILTVFVNGKRIFLRGGNWGLSEGQLRLDEEGYDIRVRLHKEANFTMIRNWVGMTGSKYFYKACDKYGILIWDDFWLANPGDGPNPNDEAMFMENAKDKIKWVRNHPSVALYCGRNEGTPPPTLNAALQNAVDALDGTRIYVPHSADQLVSGWGPYAVRDPKWYFQDRNNRKIHSEIGMPNVPSVESMKAMLPEDKYWPINEMWGIHDYCNSAQGAVAYTTAVRKYGIPNSLEDFCIQAQMVNMENHKAMFESFVAAKANGILMWMSQSAWPSTVWQTYDYYLEQTAGYYGCKKAGEPLHVLWEHNSNKVKLANNTGTSHNDLSVTAYIYNMDGTFVSEKSLEIALLQEDELKDCFTLSFPSDISAVHFIKLVLKQKGILLSDNFYWRGKTYQAYSSLSQMNKVGLKTAIEKESQTGCTVQISNPTNDVALMIRLKTLKKSSDERVLPVYYSDNYFSLLPGETKTVTLEFDPKYTGGEFPRVMIEGWNIKAAEVGEDVSIKNITSDSSSSISIFPNPTNQLLFVKGMNNFDVEIFDLSGVKVGQKTKQNDKIDISCLPSGTYLVKLSDAEKVYSQKIMKQ